MNSSIGAGTCREGGWEGTKVNSSIGGRSGRVLARKGGGKEHGK